MGNTASSEDRGYYAEPTHSAQPERELDGNAGVGVGGSGAPRSDAQQQQQRQQRESKCPVSGASSRTLAGAAAAAARKDGEATRDAAAAEGGGEKAVYNVYAQRINPENQMPYNANQQPHPGQKHALPTERVRSTISKGNADGETWTYPSPQMFYNALKRKGKGEDVQEEDVPAMVTVHNNMNERTWRRVMQYEALHADECADPKLLRFRGRPDELSDKARLRVERGEPEPFDRHDWVIDRCGKHVKYIIDYFYDESKADSDEMPGLHDEDKVKSITFDARPAGPEGLGDRLAMAKIDAERAAAQAAEKRAAKDTTPPTRKEEGVESIPVGGAEGTSIGALSASDAHQKRQLMSTRCDHLLKRFEAAELDGNDDEMTKQYMALTLCRAKVVCESRAARFESTFSGGNAQAFEAAFEAMGACVENFDLNAAMATRDSSA